MSKRAYLIFTSLLKLTSLHVINPMTLCHTEKLKLDFSRTDIFQTIQHQSLATARLQTRIAPNNLSTSRPTLKPLRANAHHHRNHETRQVSQPPHTPSNPSNLR